MTHKLWLKRANSKQFDFSISDAIKLLDPTAILGQFQPDVRTTLQSQMCTVPNIDNRIVSANDLLRQLVDADTAKLMNHINEKLPMYLSFLPGKIFSIAVLVAEFSCKNDQFWPRLTILNLIFKNQQRSFWPTMLSAMDTKDQFLKLLACPPDFPTICSHVMLVLSDGPLIKTLASVWKPVMMVVTTQKIVSHQRQRV